MESFVDLTYRGLSLGRRVKLTQVRPTTGYLETPAPMPVGTAISIATDEGHQLDAIVTAIHEQVGGSDRVPGMTVKPALDGALAAWWKERVALPDEEPPPPRARSVTVRPRTSTLVEETPAGAAVRAVAPAPPPAPPPTTTQPMPTIADAALAAIAAASQTIDQAAAGGAPGGKTVAMTAVFDPRTSDEIPVTRISDLMAAASVPAEDGEPASAPVSEPVGRTSGEYEVVDDGKKTMMMDAVDMSALGLELPGTTGQMAAVKPDDDGDDEPEPRKSSPNMPSTVKKRKKRNR